MCNSGSECGLRDKKGRSPCHFAAQHNHPAILNFLLSKGMDIEGANDSGRRPQHVAAMHGGMSVADPGGGGGGGVGATGERPKKKKKKKNGSTMFFFLQIFVLECLKILKAQIKRESIKTTLELPEPLSGSWTPAESELVPRL